MELSCLPVSLFPLFFNGELSISEWARLGRDLGLEAIVALVTEPDLVGAEELVVTFLLHHVGEGVVSVGNRRQDLFDHGAVSAAKSALESHCRQLAMEFAKLRSGVTVNAIAPGWTRTERVEELMTARAKANGTTPEEELKKQSAAIPFGRMGEPDEFADALVWLASPRASYVHGVVLPVDGGTIKASL